MALTRTRPGRQRRGDAFAVRNHPLLRGCPLLVPFDGRFAGNALFPRCEGVSEIGRCPALRTGHLILSLKMTSLDFRAGEMTPLLWPDSKSWIYVEKCCRRGKNGKFGTKYADFDSKFVRNLFHLCFNRGFQEANLVIIFDIWTAASCKRTKFLFVFILWK